MLLPMCAGCFLFGFFNVWELKTHLYIKKPDAFLLALLFVCFIRDLLEMADDPSSQSLNPKPLAVVWVHSIALNTHYCRLSEGRIKNVTQSSPSVLFRHKNSGLSCSKRRSKSPGSTVCLQHGQFFKRQEIRARWTCHKSH